MPPATNLPAASKPAHAEVVPPTAPGDITRDKRRARLFVGGVMVLVGAATCVGTLVISSFLETPRSQGDDIAAVLVADDALPWLTQISNDSEYPPSGIRYEDFHGLSVVSIANRDGGEGSRCLYVVPQVTAAAMTGACSAGPFPAQATLLVTADLPADLTDAYVIGTALQFTLDGDQVIVRTATPYGAGVPPVTAR